MSESPPAYRVLARKYRPSRFAELLGQAAMVQTLANAIKRDRIAHAFLLTGVRGVGKTSTARLIAKALNCIGIDGQGAATIDSCNQCAPCISIAEGRHIDVIEMDAASHTGVDDVREIIEAVRYASVSARYKIYIIDEVHMLSKNAFNALLKTLEEPPPHVKFIFATTEIDKVPITVLSRCMRFDLKRIPLPMLAAHFTHVVAAEGSTAEPEALQLIARAAEGSVRDGLSILDQALAHADTESESCVRVSMVRTMLGLSDRGAVRRMFGEIVAGDAAALLASMKAQYALGVDPLHILKALQETCHALTLVKTGAEPEAALAQEDRDAQAEMAARLSFGQLHRLWQMLLKGYQEVQSAADAQQALEMALLRLIYASSLPDPSELVKRLEAGAGGGGSAASGSVGVRGVAAYQAQRSSAAPSDEHYAPQQGSAHSGYNAHSPYHDSATPQAAQHADMPQDFPALVALLEKAGKATLAFQLYESASLVSYTAGRLVLHPLRPLDIAGLAQALKSLTGAAWAVETSAEPGAPSLAATHAQERMNHPIIAAAFAAFPQAKFV